MKKSEFLKKLIEEVIKENLEEISNIQSRKKRTKNEKNPLDNDINNSDFLTDLGKLQSSLHIKHPRRDGGASQQRAINYLRKKGYDI